MNSPENSDKLLSEIYEDADPSSEIGLLKESISLMTNDPLFSVLKEKEITE
jgi:hypothetical protein